MRPRHPGSDPPSVSMGQSTIVWFQGPSRGPTLPPTTLGLGLLNLLRPHAARQALAVKPCSWASAGSTSSGVAAARASLHSLPSYLLVGEAGGSGQLVAPGRGNNSPFTCRPWVPWPASPSAGFLHLGPHSQPGDCARGGVGKWRATWRGNSSGSIEGARGDGEAVGTPGC